MNGKRYDSESVEGQKWEKRTTEHFPKVHGLFAVVWIPARLSVGYLKKQSSLLAFERDLLNSPI